MFAARARSKRAAALPTFNGSGKKGSSPPAKRKSVISPGGAGIFDKLLFSGALLLLCFTIVNRTNMSSTLSTGNRSGPKSITFHGNPTKFVKKLKDCDNDKGCRVFYHHVQKTGEIGVSLAPFFNQGAPFQSGESCCFAYYMENFRKDPQQYCHQRSKFLEFEVMPDQFEEVMETCLEESNITRIVGISTYREPMQRVVNNIFQHCNRGGCAKDDDKCNNACKVCRLTEGTREFYKDFTGRSNTIYEDQLSLLSSYSNKHVQMLAVEDTEVNDMITRLGSSLGRNITTVQLDQMQDGQCNFEVSTSMMTIMKPSIEGYKGILRLP